MELFLRGGVSGTSAKRSVQLLAEKERKEKMEKETRESQVSKELGRCSTSLDNLEVTINDLLEKLKPVINNTCFTGEKEKEEKAPSLVPLAEKIKSINCRIIICAERLEVTKNRLEI